MFTSAASWSPGLPAVRKLCRVMHTDSPLLSLQLDELNNSREGQVAGRAGHHPHHLAGRWWMRRSLPVGALYRVASS